MKNLLKLEEFIDKDLMDLINQKLDISLKEYLFEEILEKYNSFDKGHRIDHIGTVLNSSLKLASFYDISIPMVVTITVFHDIGMSIDRPNHHIHSKNIVLNDCTLKNYFSEDEIQIIAEACAEHRASLKKKPTTIYGCIISDADRTTNIHDMIVRCYYFSKEHFGNLSDLETYERVYNHLKNKYGTGGYAVFYLPESQDVVMKPLIEAQEILKDENKFKNLYLHMVAKIKLGLY
jgi:uncharacterized protein